MRASSGGMDKAAQIEEGLFMVFGRKIYPSPAVLGSEPFRILEANGAELWFTVASTRPLQWDLA